MTTATLPAPIVKSPSKTLPYRWTVKRFHYACERQVWGAGKRMILISGELYEVPGITLLQADGLRVANQVFASVFANDVMIRCQFPLVLDTNTCLFPDLSILPQHPTNLIDGFPTRALFTLEVGRMPLEFDLTTIATLQATANVLESWVLDLCGRNLYVLRHPTRIPNQHEHNYSIQLNLSEQDTIAPLFAPDKPIRVSDLLP